MSFIEQFLESMNNPALLEGGLAVVYLALAVASFCERRHLHGCLYCAAGAFAAGLALIAASLA